MTTLNNGIGRKSGYKAVHIVAILFAIVLINSCSKRKIIRHEEWKILDVLYNEADRTLFIKGIKLDSDQIYFLIIPKVSDRTNDEIKSEIFNSKYEWIGSDIYYDSVEQEYFNVDGKNIFLRKDFLQFYTDRQILTNNSVGETKGEGYGGDREFQSSKIVTKIPKTEMSKYISLNVKDWKKLIYEERYEYIPQTGGP